MDSERLKRILEDVAAGTTRVDDAARKLAHLDYECLGYATVDHHRAIRKGFPEVIYGEGKTAEQISGIMSRMAEQKDVILATRVDEAKAARVLAGFPEAQYDPVARMIILATEPVPDRGRGTVVVLSAGTSDLPVAREAFLTARLMGNRCEELHDVGVSGLHRLLAHGELLEKAEVFIVAAGMEGALPSVVAGLYPRPVIAVPTSVGYGASFGGVTALLAMLNSCASNVAVVNIDNGFGAGYTAAMMNRDRSLE
ncbi:MAG: nickel pincer cofactor biosynthesis protein LarB [Desulfatibacillaceae bacterium]